MAEMFVCEKCGRSMDGTKFYQKKDGEKTKLCKNCLTMHIDNFDPNTFLWILKDMDIPYIPEEWNVLRDRAFAKNPNLTGLSVIGKYISKMKLKQWSQYGWEDSERLQALREEKDKAKDAERVASENILRAQMEQGLITEAQYKTLVSTDTQNEALRNAEVPVTIPDNLLNPYENFNNFMKESDLIDLGADLTEDDKKALAMKWGRLYKPSEWVELEKTYNEMTESFDIQDADTINTLILICKTNLKMNRFLDQGDIEGFQKISKVSENLRKSAKFTAAQNKEQKEDFVDSVGELITICERDGFIPRFPTDIPQDKVDLTLQDMNEYVRKLVTQDLGFGKRIEDAIKKIQIQAEMADASDNEPELEDEDFKDFYEEVSAQKEQDEASLEEDGEN